MSVLLETPKDLRPLTDAAQWWIPRRFNNRPVSTATLHRWAKRGVKGVKLDVVYTADGAVTSREACRRFLAAVDAARRAEMQEKSEADYPATEDQLKAAGL